MLKCTEKFPWKKYLDIIGKGAVGDEFSRLENSEGRNPFKTENWTWNTWIINCLIQQTTDIVLDLGVSVRVHVFTYQKWFIDVEWNIC